MDLMEGVSYENQLRNNSPNLVLIGKTPVISSVIQNQ